MTAALACAANVLCRMRCDALVGAVALAFVVAAALSRLLWHFSARALA